MASLKVYYDLLSQPSRAIYIFLKINNIPFIDKPVALRKVEHKNEEYTKVNCFQKVPAIDDDGFVLRESVAILKYLTIKNNLADHWYPKDFHTQLRVDEYLHWQHFNTRLNAAMVFRNLLLEPQLTGKPISWKRVEFFKNELATTVEHLDKAFLQDGPYLAGQKKISICDILGACELMQLNAVHEEACYESNSNVNSWMQRVKKDLSPHFDEAHKIVYRAREVFGESKSKL
ncbi:glutathione S-transferase theta-1 [Octopus sinensis]|uniref:Glutathione S-transferase theta-1 n=1 Tax=Octopus sinensis TaxID=2607531 RepID=A0A6P7SN99_9MOLL|nr:glutathione S-transferase theta-1 [Octopus sinensis]